MNSILPPMPEPPKRGARGLIKRHPTMLIGSTEGAPDPDRVEEMLTEWFGAPTLLFSSGRAACQVFLAEIGFHRYRHTITVPTYVTRCILNALGLNAFPVHAGGDAVLYYHPYGFRLRSSPRESVVVEDACHAFFTSPDSGERAWAGPVCIFSLSKFFSTAGIVGALVVPDPELARRLRVRRDSGRNINPVLAEWRREIIVGANVYGDDWSGTRLLDSAYALLTEFPRVEPQALAGFPGELAGLCAAGAARSARLQRFADLLGRTFPHFMLPRGLDDLPFVLPYFGSGERDALLAIDQKLLEMGVWCGGVYALNVSGSIYEPVYEDCLLIPCHQYMALDAVDAICDVIRQIDLGVKLDA